MLLLGPARLHEACYCQHLIRCSANMYVALGLKSRRAIALSNAQFYMCPAVIFKVRSVWAQTEAAATCLGLSHAQIQPM